MKEGKRKKTQAPHARTWASPNHARRREGLHVRGVSSAQVADYGL